MSETPRAIAEDIVLTYGGSVGLMDAIIDAIMAERERCLNVARAEAEKRLENVGGYPAARVHDFLVVARSIERKIESGANAAANSPALESAAATRTATTEIGND